MGYQQLLILMLAAIFVGAAIIIGVNMFTDREVDINKAAVLQDCMTLAVRAQQWYRTPKILGGGGQSFTGITLEEVQFPVINENGSFEVVVNDTSQIMIIGIGSKPNPVNPLTVQIITAPDSIYAPTINIP